MGRLTSWVLFCLAAALLCGALGSALLALAMAALAAGLVAMQTLLNARRAPEPALSMRETLERKMQDGSLRL